MADEATYSRLEHPDVFQRKLGSVHLVLGCSDDQPRSLGPLAQAILTLLEFGSLNRTEIAADLQAVFPGAIRLGDLSACLEDLLDNRLIAVDRAGGPDPEP